MGVLVGIKGDISINMKAQDWAFTVRIHAYGTLDCNSSRNRLLSSGRCPRLHFLAPCVSYPNPLRPFGSSTIDTDCRCQSAIATKYLCVSFNDLQEKKSSRS